MNKKVYCQNCKYFDGRNMDCEKVKKYKSNFFRPDNPIINKPISNKNNNCSGYQACGNGFVDFDKVKIHPQFKLKSKDKVFCKDCAHVYRQCFHFHCLAVISISDTYRGKSPTWLEDCQANNQDNQCIRFITKEGLKEWEQKEGVPHNWDKKEKWWRKPFDFPNRPPDFTEVERKRWNENGVYW